MECKPKNSMLGDFITGLMVIAVLSAIAITAYLSIIEPKHHAMLMADNELHLRLDSLSVKLNSMESKLDSMMMEIRTHQINTSSVSTTHQKSPFQFQIPTLNLSTTNSVRPAK